jgi:hypothetical protein
MGLYAIGRGFFGATALAGLTGCLFLLFPLAGFYFRRLVEGSGAESGLVRYCVVFFFLTTAVVCGLGLLFLAVGTPYPDDE